jgi:hypothetical protein
MITDENIYTDFDKGKKVLNVSRIETPIGTMIAGSVNEGICLLEFDDQKNAEYKLNKIAVQFRSIITQGTDAHLEELKKKRIYSSTCYCWYRVSKIGMEGLAGYSVWINKFI